MESPRQALRKYCAIETRWVRACQQAHSKGLSGNAHRSPSPHVLGFSTVIYVANENAMLVPATMKAPVEMMIVCAMQNERGMLNGSMRYIIPWATLSGAVAIQITKKYSPRQKAPWRSVFPMQYATGPHCTLTVRPNAQRTVEQPSHPAGNVGLNNIAVQEESTHRLLRE